MSLENTICPVTRRKCVAGCYDRDGSCFINNEAKDKAKAIKNEINSIAIESINKAEVVNTGTENRLNLADLIARRIKELVNQ